MFQGTVETIDVDVFVTKYHWEEEVPSTDVWDKCCRQREVAFDFSK